MKRRRRRRAEGVGGEAWGDGFGRPRRDSGERSMVRKSGGRFLNATLTLIR